MTLSLEDKIELIKLRINNANEILNEAKVLLDNNMLKGASNRLYYSLFNAVHALALKDNYSCKTHSTLQSFFNKEYIKTNIISQESGKTYNKSLQIRTSGDYQISPTLTKKQLLQLFKEANKLHIEIMKILNLG